MAVPVGFFVSKSGSHAGAVQKTLEVCERSTVAQRLLLQNFP